MAYSWGSALPVLDGARVRLRVLRDEDVAALFEIFGDAEAMRYWGSLPLRDLTGARPARPSPC